jgi:hypothetical protein
MATNAKKTPKRSRTKKAPVKDLTVKDAKAVRGGLFREGDKDGNGPDYGSAAKPGPILNHNEVLVR